MTRKDYIAIAAIVRATMNDLVYPDRDKFSLQLFIDGDGGLADYMAADNPHFDRDKFIRACYGE